jgi:hypothetical protein
MELGEIYERFLSLEDELDLFEKKVDNVAFWERVRASVFLTMFEMIVRSEAIMPVPGMRRRKLMRLFTSIFKVHRNPFLSRERDVLFVGSPRRLLQSDGRWWDIYTDPIIERLDTSYVSVENQYLQKHSKPAKTSNLKYMDFLDFWAYIKQKKPFGSFSLTGEERSLLKSISEEFENRFQTDMDIEEITVGVLKRRRAALPLFIRLLRRVKPKIVIIVVSYGKEDLVEACRALSIPVIELQHGVISRFHPGYSYPVVKKLFPDYLLTFGDYWLDSAEFPLDRDRIRSVGYPYLENQKAKLRNVEKKRQAVIISQERIGLHLSRFAVELSEAKEFDYNIVYKLHPREAARWKESYPWLVDANLKVVDDPSVSLYKLFAESSIQIGVFSTAIYEGLSFGLQTYLVDLPGVAYFEQLIQTQVVTKVSSVDDFLEKLKLQTDMSLFESEHFFKSNAIANIIQELKRIMNA